KLLHQGGGDDVGGDDVMMMMMVVDLWCRNGGCDDVRVMVWLYVGSGGSGDGDDVCLRCTYPLKESRPEIRFVLIDYVTKKRFKI
nr:hypothetical protein [Tanacetum cinerariifolium]